MVAASAVSRFFLMSPRSLYGPGLSPSRALFALAILLWVAASQAQPTFVGTGVCVDCHADQAKAWRSSHHALAMAEASERTVLGDFDDAQFTAHGITSRFYRSDGGFHVRTDGPDGSLQDYRIRYTFGWYPLQQYLIEMPRGHVQALGIAWDTRSEAEGGQRWFHLYPNEPMDHRHALHWTSREQTWNYQCAECHSTRLEKNYDLETDSYATTFAEISVGCEACHGPGSAHVMLARQAEQDPSSAAEAAQGLVIGLAGRAAASWSIDPESGKPRRSAPRTDHSEMQLCARCHSRRGQLWSDYEHGRPLGDTHRLALLDDHLYFADGQIRDEVFVYGSFIQSKMYRSGVTCSDCHDAHSGQLHAEGNAVCGSCHLPTRYDTETHHHHEPGTPGATCVACHMPERVYMVNDWRADHSLRVPRPDLSVALGTPNACTGCHADQPPQWAADAIVAWYPDSAHRGAHFAEALHGATTGSATAANGLAELAQDPGQPGIARATAVDRLQGFATSEHLALIETLLKEQDPLIRTAAVRFLELTEVRTRVDLGWPMLDDPQRVVRLEAARLLAPLLRQRLPDKFRDTLRGALEEYAQSQQVNADRPESHLNLGLVALATGDPSQAEAAYRTALRLDPSFTAAYANLADLYRQQGRDADGEALLLAGIAAAPESADLPHALGLLYVRQQRLAEALPWLRRAMESAEEEPRYAYVYAIALHGEGNLDAAIEVLQQARRRHPADRDLRMALADYRRQREGNP